MIFSMEQNTEGGKRVKAVERSYRIALTLREGGTMRVKDVAEELDIPTSTAHVHLKTLESIGYVVRTETGYRSGLRYLQDGCIIRGNVSVYPIARPEVDNLAKDTGEVANLGIEETGQRVLLYQSEGSDAVYDNAPIGEYTNMHWTALGKAILAEFSREHVDEVVDRHGLPTETPNTIGDRESLHDALEAIREQGFALEDEERRNGIRSVAVPIKAEDHVLGSLSLSGPKERFNDERIAEELLPELKNRKNIVEVKHEYD